MNLNHVTQRDNNLRAVSAQARYLMNANRQRVQHRTQSMLNRAVAEIGLDG